MSPSNPYDFPDKPDVIIVDLETTIRNTGPEAVGSSKASPHCEANEVVAIGNWALDQKIPRIVMAGAELRKLRLFETPVVIVGHNVKFDLLYLLRSWDLLINDMNRHLSNLYVWDTMVVEYLLSGQQVRMPSLETTAARRKIKFKKDDKIKQYWDEGIDTDKIPEEELLDYLAEDVRVTRNIYVEQVNKAIELGMIPLIKTRMEQWLATVIMEYNGMHVDQEIFIREMATAKTNSDTWHTSVKIDLPDVDVNSPKQLYTWLYGGTKKVKIDVPVLDAEGKYTVYKSGIRKGLPKLKKEVKTEVVTGVLNTAVVRDIPPEEQNTSEETLKMLSINKGVPADVRNVLYKILKYREWAKEYNTYFVGVGNYIWPDNKIHGNLNEAVTVTGRLASSNPNLQNLPSYSED
jgi:DNA polymerase I-like protein with 3'-5' exonuclease and polymerase domains